jgi:hypothetical protein
VPVTKWSALDESGEGPGALFLFPQEFGVATGDHTPGKILLLRDPAALRQGSAIVLVLKNAKQHSAQVALSLR